MTINEFEDRYSSLKNEVSELHKKLNPLLKQLKRLSKKCITLGEKAEGDDNLYENDKDGRIVEKGWNPSVVFNLVDFDILEEVTSIESGISRILNTKFRNRPHTPQDEWCSELKKSLKNRKRGEISVDSSKLCARIMSEDLWKSKDPIVLRYKCRMFSDDCPRGQRIFYGDMVNMTEDEVRRIFDEKTANELIRDNRKTTENLKHLYSYLYSCLSKRNSK